jgi:hypothetical protein
MRYTTILGLFLVSFAPTLHAGFTIASSGKPECVIVQQPEATKPEIHAAQDLAASLNQITGATFVVQTNAEEIPRHAIIIGPGPVAAKYFPDIDFSKFGPEEFVARVKDGRLLLAGGRPRGTLYAVNRFLQDQCGVRWWTPHLTNFPHCATLRVKNLDIHTQPVFEYRGPYWSAGFDPLWKMHNEANDENHTIPANLGGSVIYKGYCHTFYPLVPPEKYFAAHPEWYSLINGKRTHDTAQLCLSNPELRDFMVERVKQWLREAPDAAIISITQNDCDGHCQCAACKAIDDAEGNPAGSMLAFVNYVAEKIEPEFPHVWVDTFAYQYTRKPPKTIRPRHNVIVRLCSIECDFRESIDHPVNAEFLSDLARWSQICPHLYVWDYTTDFGHYINPYPDWFTLGPNIRVFQKYGVKGVFEEGAYGGPGADMAEMRAWVLAQLLWNPQQDDSKLINEFLAGYYGAAAKPIRQYLDLIHEKSRGFYLNCYVSKRPPYLYFQPLAAAERLWQQAEAAVAHDPDLLARVRLSHLPVRYAWLTDWQQLRRECWEQNGDWPLPESRKAVADAWRAVAAGVPGAEWTHVRALNEHGQSVEDFLAPFPTDPPDTNGPPPPKRLASPPPPKDLSGVLPAKCIDLQDNLAYIYKPGEFSEIRPDTAASDNRAVWMPGNHQEWAFRISGTSLPAKALKGKWKVYAVMRVEKNSGAAPDAAAFSAGVYDIQTKTYPADAKVKLEDVSEGYHSHLLGTVEFTPGRDIYIAPPGGKNVSAIYIDRVYLVPAS